MRSRGIDGSTWVSDGQGLIEDCLYEDLMMVGEEVYQISGLENSV